MSSQKRVFQVEVKAVRTRGGGKKFHVWEGLKGGHCGWVVEWEKVVGDEVGEMGGDAMMQVMERSLDLSQSAVHCFQRVLSRILRILCF